MVDNTMLGPAFQHPLQLGADIVLYSATKYLSGFSDLIGGVALASDPRADSENAVAAQPVRQHPSTGRMLDAGQSPAHRRAAHESRKQECRNASRNGLPRHPKIKKVLYPSLFDDPEQIRIRHAQCDFPGAMFSLDLRGGKKRRSSFYGTCAWRATRFRWVE